MSGSANPEAFHEDREDHDDLLTSPLVYGSASNSSTDLLIVHRYSLFSSTIVRIPRGKMKSLAPGTLRARTLVFALSSIDLGFAKDEQQWQEYFPVPTKADAFCDDLTGWYVVPSYGFAVVYESKVPGITTGMILKGLCPAAHICFDLALFATTIEGFYINRYDQERPISKWAEYTIHGSISRLVALSPDEERNMAWESLVIPMWESGLELWNYLASVRPAYESGCLKLQYCNNIAATQIPLLLISIAASEPRARSFAYHAMTTQMQRRPVKFLHISDSRDVVAQSMRSFMSLVPCNAVDSSPEAILQGLKWLTEYAAAYDTRSIVVMDFTPSAPRGETFTTVMTLLQERWVSIEHGRFALPYWIDQKSNTTDNVVLPVLPRFREAGDLYTEDQQTFLRISRHILFDVQLKYGSSAADVKREFERLRDCTVSTSDGLVFRVWEDRGYKRETGWNVFIGNRKKVQSR